MELDKLDFSLIWFIYYLFYYFKYSYFISFILFMILNNFKIPVSKPPSISLRLCRSGQLKQSFNWGAAGALRSSRTAGAKHKGGA